MYPPHVRTRRASPMHAVLAIAIALAMLAAGCAAPARPKANDRNTTPLTVPTLNDTPPISTQPPVLADACGAVTSTNDAGIVKLRVLGDPCSSGLNRWPGSFESPIAVRDFNGNGVSEVVAASTDGHIYVFQPLTGHVLAKLDLFDPPPGSKAIPPGVTTAIMRPGEPPSIIAATPGAVVNAWQFVPGTSTAEEFKFVKRWHQGMPTFAEGPSMRAAPVVTDLTGDGHMEVLVETQEEGVHALRADGSFLWSLDVAGGPASPAVGDLDGDGRLDVVVGSRTGRVTVVDGATGSQEWTFDAKALVPPPASIMATPTIANLAKGGPPTILFATRDAHDPGDPGTDHFTLFALQEDEQGQPKVLWQHKAWWGAPMMGSPVAVADVDGNGVPEVLGMDWNTLGESPGDWAVVGTVHTFALNADGSEKWIRELGTWWGDKGVAIGDFDNDGRLEMLANGPKGQGDGIWEVNAATGAPERHLAFGDWQARRGGPIAVDLAGNGTRQVLIPAVPGDAGTAEHGALLLLDLGPVGPVPWTGESP